jgi:hypothetical protein
MRTGNSMLSGGGKIFEERGQRRLTNKKGCHMFDQLPLGDSKMWSTQSLDPLAANDRDLEELGRLLSRWG